MSLRLKMILGIGAIMLTAVLVYASIGLRRQEIHLLNMSKREAQMVASLADRAISRAMEQGKSFEVQLILERIADDPDISGIRIVDSAGKILRSNRSEEVDQVLPPRERPSRSEVSEPFWDYQEKTVDVLRPIMNGPDCIGCHSPQQPTLGLLQVRAAFPSIDSELAQQWTFMIILAIVCLAASGGLIGLLFTVVAGRRIDALSETMGRVEAGDLLVRAAPEGRDELGRLATSFNTMVARLADARRQLENRHAEEIRRAEHLASLGKMAAGIAHEINNPIAGMLNCVRTLRKGVRDEEQRVQYLQMVQEGLGRIGRTVGQLLNFAREPKPHLTRTELEPLLRQCLALLRDELTTRGIVCTFSQNGNLPPLVADRYQLEQVFLNILKNSVEAMPDGGRITIGLGVREEGADRFIEVEVADTGIGIPAEELPRIFDPFFTTKEVGTGLGLSVSYGIVRAHGGYIKPESETGKGSRFIVGLPAGTR